MILKVIDEEDFNLSMALDINYELEYIEVIVKAQNKKRHTVEMKTFKAAQFSEALAYFDRQERFLFGGKEGK